MKRTTTSKQRSAPAPGRAARVSRQDVARAAGVSLTTVTHALNPPPGVRVSEATRERVRRVARELGYRPSFVGRALVSGKTYTVGLLQPHAEALFYSFYQEMVHGMVRAMEADDYSLLVLFRSADQHFMRVVEQGRIDGMLVLQSDLEVGHIERLVEMGLPTVVVNKGYPVRPEKSVGCVHADHRRMMRDVVLELAALGCRSLLNVLAPRACDANIQMFEGFVAATAAAPVPGLTGVTVAPDPNAFPAQVRSLLRRGLRWDGVFVDGTGLAETFLDQARQRGLKPNRDFRLISSSTQANTTTRQRGEVSAYNHQPALVGREAWELLRDLIRGAASAQQRLVPYKRIEVQGTAAAH
jgi:DNA-binding LacI/PurR family transcriptional regulator